jgi:hypothetical protein
MLTVSIQQLTGSDDCKHMYCQDTTTGYGSPNYAIADVYRLVIDAKIPNADVYTDPYVYTGSAAQDIMDNSNDLDITTVSLNQSSTIDALTDGVYYLRYTPFWLASSTLSVTNGSTAVTGTNLTSAPYEGVNRVIIAGEYYDFNVTSATTATLDREYVGSTSGTQAWYAGFSATLPLKQICSSNKCVKAEISKVFTSTCLCSEIRRKEVFEKYEDINGANIMFEKQAYTQFQALINQLSNWCKSSDCQCK